MVDAEKMSKSKGNFLLMKECIEEFTADATRFALADAGDGLEDANFDRSVANQAVSYLFVEEEWCRGILQEFHASNEKLELSELSFLEKAFLNEIDFLVAEARGDFLRLNFREGLHHSWYDMIINRDIYRDWSQKCSRKMNLSVLFRFISCLSLMIQPICPHWSEVIHETLYPNESRAACVDLWPSFDPYNPKLRKEYGFFKAFLKTIRIAGLKQKSKYVMVFTASTYDEKKVEILTFMQNSFKDNKFENTFVKDLKTFIESNESLKRDTKQLMQFGSFMKSEAEERGADALTISLSFDQIAILQVEFLCLKLI
jgi:leucyl-tRNA synthetase